MRFKIGDKLINDKGMIYVITGINNRAEHLYHIDCINYDNYHMAHAFWIGSNIEAIGFKLLDYGFSKDLESILKE